MIQEATWTRNQDVTIVREDNFGFGILADEVESDMERDGDIKPYLVPPIECCTLNG